MKYLLVSLFLYLGAAWPGSVQKATVIEWTTPVDYDLGEIPMEKTVKVLFQYKNISDQPVSIDNVRPTCGCTAPTWTDAPIQPDSIGTIEIEYAASQPGYFRKKIKVFFKSQLEAERLYVEGFVNE
jgi:Protein of unknown function (DUF1573)